MKKGSIEHSAVSSIDSNYVQGIIRSTDTNEAFIQTYMTNHISGNLLDHIKNNVNVSYQIKEQIARQIIIGMIDTHKSGFIHRDIKPDNIVFEQNNKIKIIDFSASTKIDDFKSVMPGSEVYSAPELRSEFSDSRCDTYSVGLVLYYLFYEKHPYNELEIDEIMEAKKHGIFPQFPKDNPAYECLIKWMCALKPQDRPSDNDLLKLISFDDDLPTLDPMKDWTIFLHLLDEEYIPYLMDASIHPMIYYARALFQRANLDKMGYRYNIIASALNGCSKAISELAVYNLENLIEYDIDNILFNMKNDFACDRLLLLEEFQYDWDTNSIESTLNAFQRQDLILKIIDPYSDECFSPIFLHCGFPIPDGCAPIAIDIFDLMYPYYMDTEKMLSRSWEMIGISLINGLYLEQDIEKGLDILFTDNLITQNNIGTLFLYLCLLFGVYLAQDIVSIYQWGNVVDPIFMLLILSGHLDNKVNVAINQKRCKIEHMMEDYMKLGGIFQNISMNKFISLDKWQFKILELVRFDFNLDFFDPMSYKMFYSTSYYPMKRFPPSTFNYTNASTFTDVNDKAQVVVTIEPFKPNLKLEFTKNLQDEIKKYIEEEFIVSLKKLYDDFNKENKITFDEYRYNEVAFITHNRYSRIFHSNFGKSIQDLLIEATKHFNGISIF